MKFHLTLQLQDSEAQLKCCADWYGNMQWDLLVFDIQMSEAWRIDITRETIQEIQDTHQDAWHTDTPDAFRWVMDHAFGAGRGDIFQIREDGIPVNWGYEYVLNRENSTLKWIAHGVDQNTQDDMMVHLATLRLVPTNFLSAIDSWTSGMMSELKPRVLKPAFLPYKTEERPPRTKYSDN